MNESKKLKTVKLLETQQAVKNFLNDNFVIEPNIQEMKDNLSNYLNLVNSGYTRFRGFYDFNMKIGP